MQLLKSFVILSVLLVASACSTTPKTIIQTKIITKTIPAIERPRPVVMNDVKFYVVTEDTLDDFIAEFKKANAGELVFVATNVKGYENISLNLADIKRYLKQQNEIIVYYEKNATK